MRPLALAAVLLSLGAAPFAGGEERPKLLLQDLAARGVEEHEAGSFSTATCNALAGGKRFRVLCGDDLRMLMRFNALAAALNGCEDEKCYGAAGRALEARFIVSGSVSRVGQSLVMDLALFDVDQSEVVGRSSVKESSIDALYRRVSEAVEQLLRSSR